MYNVRKINNDLYWIGGNDRRLALFENIHPIPEGVSYNSYVLLDEKSVLFDTVDWSIARTFLDNLDHVLGGKPLDYMVINHVEPDHAASINEIILRYPKVKIISMDKAFMFMRQFDFDIDSVENIVVEPGETIKFGKHEVAFVDAPMVHWPEAMVSFDLTDGTLFAADAFGSFGALDGRIFNDEVDFDRDWIDSARRYYTNIVGKYGPHVQDLLRRASGLEIKTICPLHGPVWRNNLGYILDKYDKWSSYTPEEEGVLIIYGTMYGGTEVAAESLGRRLAERGVTNIKMYDVSKTDNSYLIADAFKYSHIVLASVTYNLNIYPPMEDFIRHMIMLNLQKRTMAVIENGSWAPQAGDKIRKLLDEMRYMNVLTDEVLINSTMKEGNRHEMDVLADSIVESFKKDKQ